MVWMEGLSLTLPAMSSFNSCSPENTFLPVSNGSSLYKTLLIFTNTNVVSTLYNVYRCSVLNEMSVTFRFQRNPDMAGHGRSGGREHVWLIVIITVV